MKFSIFLFLALIGLFITVSSCSSKKEDPAAVTQADSIPDGAMVSPDAGAARIASGTTGEAHYKCPKNCEGGTGSAKGPCPVCGTEMAHNQAFHAQAGATPGSTPETPIKVDPINSTGANTISATPSTTNPTITPEPAQNAKGVWHFTCAKGCAGGAGAQGTCATCGGPLSHNQAYHQQ